MGQNQRVNVPELLEAAALLVPDAVATGNDITVADVWDYLTHDEWEVALDLLAELADAGSLPPGVWEALAAAAEQMGLTNSAAWCRWRCDEVRNGVIRADLTLRPAGKSRRQAPFAGTGVARPMWDIGHRTPAGEPDLSIARIWVEFTRTLGPGERASVRLAPLDPARWRHLRPGRAIAMYEGSSVTGTAVVLEVAHPAT